VPLVSLKASRAPANQLYCQNPRIARPSDKINRLFEKRAGSLNGGEQAGQLETQAGKSLGITG
jgi:hypothetical protein